MIETGRRRRPKVARRERRWFPGAGGTRMPGDVRGQSLVEFALVVAPLLLLLLGIIQFGFVFNSYVTLTNAVREGARDGSIYVYDRTDTKAGNDAARNARVLSTVLSSLNLLSKSAPQFTTGGSWSQSGQAFTNGDLVVTYAVPTGVSDGDTRVGQQLTVRVTYHQDLFLPLISSFLPRDANGRLPLVAEVTMAVN